MISLKSFLPLFLVIPFSISCTKNKKDSSVKDVATNMGVGNGSNGQYGPTQYYFYVDGENIHRTVCDPRKPAKRLNCFKERVSIPVFEFKKKVSELVKLSFDEKKNSFSTGERLNLPKDPDTEAQVMIDSLNKEAAHYEEQIQILGREDFLLQNFPNDVSKRQQRDTIRNQIRANQENIFKVEILLDKLIPHKLTEMYKFSEALFSLASSEAIFEDSCKGNECTQTYFPALTSYVVMWASIFDANDEFAKNRLYSIKADCRASVEVEDYQYVEFTESLTSAWHKMNFEAVQELKQRCEDFAISKIPSVKKATGRTRDEILRIEYSQKG
jgi:hypothetical protein